MGETEQPKFYDEVVQERKNIKEVAQFVLALKEMRQSAPPDDNENRGEVMANLTLAYRHLEDASMRLGKVLQHLDGGNSVYDRDQTVGA